MSNMDYYMRMYQTMVKEQGIHFVTREDGVVVTRKIKQDGVFNVVYSDRPPIVEVEVIVDEIVEDHDTPIVVQDIIVVEDDVVYETKYVNMDATVREENGVVVSTPLTSWMTHSFIYDRKDDIVSKCSEHFRLFNDKCDRKRRKRFKIVLCKLYFLSSTLVPGNKVLGDWPLVYPMFTFVEFEGCHDPQVDSSSSCVLMDPRENNSILGNVFPPDQHSLFQRYAEYCVKSFYYKVEFLGGDNHNVVALTRGTMRGLGDVQICYKDDTYGKDVLEDEYVIPYDKDYRYRSSTSGFDIDPHNLFFLNIVSTGEEETKWKCCICYELEMYFPFGKRDSTVIEKYYPRSVMSRCTSKDFQELKTNLKLLDMLCNRLNSLGMTLNEGIRDKFSRPLYLFTGLRKEISLGLPLIQKIFPLSDAYYQKDYRRLKMDEDCYSSYDWVRLERDVMTTRLDRSRSRIPVLVFGTYLLDNRCLYQLAYSSFFLFPDKNPPFSPLFLAYLERSKGKSFLVVERWRQGLVEKIKEYIDDSYQGLDVEDGLSSVPICNNYFQYRSTKVIPSGEIFDSYTLDEARRRGIKPEEVGSPSGSKVVCDVLDPLYGLDQGEEIVKDKDRIKLEEDRRIMCTVVDKSGLTWYMPELNKYL